MMIHTQFLFNRLIIPKLLQARPVPKIKLFWGEVLLPAGKNGSNTNQKL